MTGISTGVEKKPLLEYRQEVSCLVCVHEFCWWKISLVWEGNVFSLNISSFHVEPERRVSVCRHIHMGFDKPAQMGRGPRLPSGARVE